MHTRDQHAYTQTDVINTPEGEMSENEKKKKITDGCICTVKEVITATVKLVAEGCHHKVTPGSHIHSHMFTPLTASFNHFYFHVFL